MHAALIYVPVRIASLRFLFILFTLLFSPTFHFSFLLHSSVLFYSNPSSLSLPTHFSLLHSFSLTKNLSLHRFLTFSTSLLPSLPPTLSSSLFSHFLHFSSSCLPTHTQFRHPCNLPDRARCVVAL